MESKLDGMKVAILATTGFEEVEMTEPREALENAGASTFLVSPNSGSIRSWDHTEWGDEYEVDLTLDEADAADFDALLLPGGVLNPDKLRMNEKAVAFVRRFFDEGKPVAAICHGPWTLIDAGVVKGRRMTAYRSLQTDLKNAGAIFVDEAPVTDGNLVTARNPDDLPAFNEAMINLFAQVNETVSG